MFLHAASLSLPQVFPKLLPEDAENIKIFGTKQSSWLEFYAVLFPVFRRIVLPSPLQSSSPRTNGILHRYIHTYTHTHTHTRIPWIHKCVTKTAGCGTSCKYTNVQIYSAKYYEHFI